MALDISGQIELYGLFWYELQTALIAKKVSRDNINKIRPLFEEVFGLPDTKGNKENRKLVEWNQYVIPLKL